MLSLLDGEPVKAAPAAMSLPHRITMCGYSMSYCAGDWKVSVNSER